MKNHPFLDGNKRMAFLAAAVFIEINGWSLHASEEDVADQTVALAAGTCKEEEYALWLKASCKRDPTSRRREVGIADNK